MSKTTSEWEALLEGTTDGPWRIDTSDPDWPQLVGPVVLEGNLITMEILVDELGQLEDPNLHLAAAAPAAVAEVVRLRRELEQLRDQLRDDAGFEALTKYEKGLANSYGYTANNLTTILEGTNE